MPELVIPVGEHIGPGYIDWDDWDYVPGFTVDEVKMHVAYGLPSGEDVDSILLQIGICYGGSVLHAMDIFNYLRSLNLPIRTHIMSLAASSGTIVALAGDTVTMEETAQWMVHRPLFLGGTGSERSEDMRADADWLDRCEQSLRAIYAAKTGKADDEIRQLISVDRFMSAQEAKDFGFVNTVNPLTRTAPAEADVTARTTRFKLAVASTSRRAAHSRQDVAAKLPALSASLPTSVMSKIQKPAAAAAAAKPVPTPRAATPAGIGATIVSALAKAFGVKATIEGEGSGEPVAEIQSTELSNGALLYHEGALAVDTAVFNDEALTEATSDGDYDAADGRVISVAGGVVTAIQEASAEGGEGEAEASTADLLKRIEALEQKDATAQTTIKELQASLDKFQKTVPPTPQPRNAKATGSQVDAKQSAGKAHPMDRARG